LHAAVIEEAAKYVQATDAMDSDGPTREKLQEEMKKAEAAVVKLEALDADDPDVADLLALKRQKRDTARSLLHAARPLRSRLKEAEETRDKACRKHAALSEEVHSLKLVLEAKEKLLAEAVAEVKATLKQVSVLHEKIVQEEDVAPPVPAAAAAMPGTPQPTLTAVQAAAALAHLLPPEARASFEGWCASAPMQAHVEMKDSDDEEEDLEMIDAANRQAFSAYLSSNGLDLPLENNPGAFGPAGSHKRVRIDPYGSGRLAQYTAAEEETYAVEYASAHGSIVGAPGGSLAAPSAVA